MPRLNFAAAALVATFALLPPAVLAQDDQGAAQDAQERQQQTVSLTDLSLEELMEIDVISLNVLGTHTHLAGQWMVRYRYMLMGMTGNRDGTQQLSSADVLARFPITPTNMTMQMHMFEVMYAPSDRLTLMAMLPYKRLSMDHVNRGNVVFTTDAAGIGDLTLRGLYTFYGNPRRGGHRLLFNPGVTIPTGSISRRDDTPLGPNQPLPYPMQLGSGTVDLWPAAGYAIETRNWAWFLEGGGTIRVGRNDRGYRLGNRLRVSAWGARRIHDWISVSGEIVGEAWGNIRGADPVLNPRMVPTADPLRRGGQRIDLSLGVNFYLSRNRLEGQWLAIEAIVPGYRSLDGPQLENDWQLLVGWVWVTYGRRAP